MASPVILVYSSQYEAMAGIRHKDDPCRVSVIGLAYLADKEEKDGL